MAPDVRFRLIGLLNDHTRPSPFASDRLMATFGPALYHLPRHGFEDVLVAVAWLETNSPRLPDDAQPPMVFRRGYCRHRPRNRRIAKLAIALAAGNPECSAMLAPGAELRNVPRSDCRVAVLVDTIDHAIALAEHLPDWPIWTASNLDNIFLNEQQRQLLRRRSCQWARPNICIVPGWIPNADHFDVFIWAGGGRVSPLVSQRPPICPVGQPRQLLVIDVDDRHHPLLRRWSRSRLKAYQQINWFAPGISMRDGRIDRFLRERCSP